VCVCVCVWLCVGVCVCVCACVCVCDYVLAKGGVDRCRGRQAGNMTSRQQRWCCCCVHSFRLQFVTDRQTEDCMCLKKSVNIQNKQTNIQQNVRLVCVLLCFWCCFLSLSGLPSLDCSTVQYLHARREDLFPLNNKFTRVPARLFGAHNAVHVLCVTKSSVLPIEVHEVYITNTSSLMCLRDVFHHI